MEWYDSFQHKPKHGTQIFMWDIEKQKKILLNAFWDEDKFHPTHHFPFWRYVLSGIDPIKIKEI